MAQKKFQSLIDKTIQNIEEDRSVTNKLLTDLVLYMAKTGDSSHQSMGHVAAQYLETLQRSNEQLVKIASLVQKDEGKTRGLDSIEKDFLFDSIKEG
jgi:hypothetical protein